MSDIDLCHDAGLAYEKWMPLREHGAKMYALYLLCPDQPKPAPSSDAQTEKGEGK